jgi:hypothetical protein
MKTSLEHILDTLKLSEEQKSELYSNIRGFDLEDDNDPLLRITLVLSLLAKFTEEIPEKLAYERQMLETIIKEQKEYITKLSGQIDNAAVGIKENAAAASGKILNTKSKWVKSCFLYSVFIILFSVLGIGFNYFYTFRPIQKTYQARSEFLKKCANTPEIFRVNGRRGWYLTVESDSVIKLQNGQIAAQLKGYY